MKMRLSYFGLIEHIDAIAAAGYDCAELHIKEIAGLDDGQFAAAKKKLRDSGITAEVYDNPLPLELAIADESFKIADWTGYIKKVVDRTAEMGARYFVYGNGKTRSLPADGNAKKNDEMLAFICETAAKANITVLLELLGIEKSNVFLSMDEIYQYAKKSGIPNIKAVVDYRWLLAGKHNVNIIEQYADFIHDVHIDNPTLPFPNRLVPTMDDGHDYSPLLNTLKKICYKGIIAIEANPTDHYAQDLKTGLAFFAGHGLNPYRS